MRHPSHRWPPIDYPTWQPTGDTLQRWLQIVGKIRTRLTPWTNHGWNCTLYVTSTGLTTSLIPYEPKPFSIDFDFTYHTVLIQTAEGDTREILLERQTVSSFYHQLLGTLLELGISISISKIPDEVTDRTPFDRDDAWRLYDPETATLFWQSLVRVYGVMTEFRSQFVGKCSPVHFFWGSMDLACTRFSGRRAPEHPGGYPTLADKITKEAYSHEVSSCGFWPGSALYPQAAFYSYAYPSPPGFESARVPKGAHYHPTLKEFVLPYQTVIESGDPYDFAFEFFQCTYEAAARLGNWDRELLEKSEFLSALQGSQIPPVQPLSRSA